MPTLNWIGKEAVVKHHKEVPFRILQPVAELSYGEASNPENENLIVQGDNLHALKALLPRYAGKVKCIYIDPPYNTGQDDRDQSGKRTGWVYNDNVNSQEMKQWLNKVVGEESEDLSRHDKWLCMIYPRLVLLKSFLKDDGVIFVSIDENEYANLRIVLDEIFGIVNRVGTIIWKNVTDNNPTNIAIEHEYILCYAKRKDKLAKEWKSTNLAVKEKLLNISEKFVTDYTDQEARQAEYTKWFRKNKDQLWPFDRYKFIDLDGIYTGSQSVHNPGKEGYRYDVIHPVTMKPCAQPMMGYRFPEATMNDLIRQGRILFGESETKLVELKVYVKDYRVKLASLFELDGRIGTNEVKDIFVGNNRPFDFPKPTVLIEELISFTTTGNDLILDSFAGSGTTGHAVLKLNKADSQNRRFILVEMKNEIATNITSERVKQAIIGYKNNEPLGGSFKFCRLSAEALFTAEGQIRSNVTFSELAEFVWFTETGTGYPTHLMPSPMLGVHKGKAVYLLFNGILKDRGDLGGNVLNNRTLAVLPAHDGQRVVYGSRTRFDKAKLIRMNIEFKQLPYELTVKSWI